jgi:hypothetical protein
VANHALDERDLRMSKPYPTGPSKCNCRVGVCSAASPQGMSAGPAYLIDTAPTMTIDSLMLM